MLFCILIDCAWAAESSNNFVSNKSGVNFVYSAEEKVLETLTKRKNLIIIMAIACVVVIFAFSMCLLKSDVAHANEEFTLSIDGKTITTDSDDLNGHWNFTNAGGKNVLTLSNYNGGAISCIGNLEIVLVGKNTIKMESNSQNILFGLYAKGDLRISNNNPDETASLEVDSSNVDLSKTKRAIWVEGNVNVSSTKLTVGEFLCSRTNLLNGNINFENSDISINSNSESAIECNDLTFSNSKIELFSKSKGVVSIGNVTVSGGNLSLKTGKTAVSASNFDVSNAVVQIETNGTQSDYAVLTTENFRVSNNANFKAFSNCSVALHCRGNLIDISSKIVLMGKEGAILAPNVGQVSVFSNVVSDFKGKSFTVSESEEILKGDFGYIVVDQDKFCWLEKIDNSAKGWKYQVMEIQNELIPTLTLFGYHGEKISCEVLTQKPIHFNVVALVDTENSIVTNSEIALFSNGALTLSGNGFLRIETSHQDGKGVTATNFVANQINCKIVSPNVAIECQNAYFQSGIQIVNGGKMHVDATGQIVVASNVVSNFSDLYTAENSSDGVEIRFGNHAKAHDVLATSLQINDEKFSDLKNDIIRENWKWNADFKVLILDGFVGKTLQFDGSTFEIILKNGSENILNNSEIFSMVNERKTYFGIFSTGNVSLLGNGKISIDTKANQKIDTALSIKASGNVKISNCQIVIQSSSDGVLSENGNVFFEKCNLNLQTEGFGVKAYNNIIFDADCKSYIYSNEIALHTLYSTISIEGGDIIVFGALTSALSMNGGNIKIGSVVYVSGSVEKPYDSKLKNKFVVKNGVVVENLNFSTFYVVGVRYVWTGETIDKMSEAGWCLEFVPEDSKFVLNLNGYNSGAFVFNFPIYINILNTNTISNENNLNSGNNNASIFSISDIWMLGDGKLNLESKTNSGIGVLCKANLYVGGEIEIVADKTAIGLKVDKQIVFDSKSYSGSRVDVGDFKMMNGVFSILNVGGFDLFTIANNCEIVGGSINLKDNGKNDTVACLNVGDSTIMQGGQVQIDSLAKDGIGIKSKFLRLNVGGMQVNANGSAMKISDRIFYSEKVFAIVGEDVDNLKMRKIASSDKIVKTLQFDLDFQNIKLDKIDMENNFVFELGKHISQLSSITLGNFTLVQGKDYFVNSEKVEILQSIFEGKENGVYDLQFHFGEDFVIRTQIEREIVEVGEASKTNEILFGVLSTVTLVMILIGIMSIKYREKQEKAKK